MSSYNDFLSKIEVDEKELKRDLQNRNKNKNRDNNQISNKPLQKIPTNNKSLGSKDGLNPKNLKKSVNPQATNNPEQRRVVTGSMQKPNLQVDKSRSELVRNVSSNNRQAVNSRLPVASAVGASRKNVSQAKVSRAEAKTNLTKERLIKEKVHLRQKKINDQLSKDKALVEKHTFNISKEEYDKKILGSIRQQQTKMIFLRDGEKLAKVPKSVAFLGAYAFLLSIVMLVAFSVVGNKKMELRALNGQFNALNDVNAQLNIKLATAYNIDNIRTRAENELYMNKPETHQVMYITVIPENYVEYEMESDNE